MTRTVGLFVVLTLFGVPALAQTPPPAPPPTAPAAVVPSSGFERIMLTAGRSTVLPTAFDITRIAVTNPAVADAVVVQPREVLIDGKSAGTISLIIWGVASRVQYDVVVEPGVTTLQQKLQALFPGEDITATVNDEALVLSGHASSTAVMLKAGEIAAASASKLKVINLLQLPGGLGSQQVMLQVRFAEVNRRALKELGSSFFLGPNGENDYVARTSTQQYAAAAFDDTTTTFSDLLNLFVLNRKYNLSAMIRALQSKGQFQSLAEPNLIAYNAQTASFLAGGEFPVPVVQGLSNSVTVQWKEFGVRLAFTPTIAGDMIRLKVRPEVSSLDFNNGITLQGFRIPALTSRYAETDVELRDGQSFAIAGLLHNTSQSTAQGIPILSRIPIIGALFRSNSDQREQTELMVLVTPQLVRPLDPDEVPALPTAPGRFLQSPGVGSQLEGGGLVDAPAVAPKPAPPVIKKDPEA